MSPIDHAFIDTYVSVAGDPDRLTTRNAVDMALWEVLDGLLLDLHLIRHGYATDGYAKHIENELRRVCADADVVRRIKELRT
jgi:hypothetical protein